MLRKDALIVYYKSEDSALCTSKMLTHLGYSNVIRHYRKVEPSDLTFTDLIVLTTPEIPDMYKREPLDKLLNTLWRLNIPIMGLGDINSMVLESLGNKFAFIDNHMLDTVKVHNIRDYHGKEYFIPSRHKTTLFTEDIEYYDINKKESISNTYNFINVVCTSPSRSPNYNLPIVVGEKLKEVLPLNLIEVEIFLIDTMNYIGIFGAPELFFEEEDSHINLTVRKTLNLIESLIKILQDAKSNCVR